MPDAQTWCMQGFLCRTSEHDLMTDMVRATISVSTAVTKRCLTLCQIVTSSTPHEALDIDRWIRLLTFTDRYPPSVCACAMAFGVEGLTSRQQRSVPNAQCCSAWAHRAALGHAGMLSRCSHVPTHLSAHVLESIHAHKLWHLDCNQLKTLHANKLWHLDRKQFY